MSRRGVLCDLMIRGLLSTSGFSGPGVETLLPGGAPLRMPLLDRRRPLQDGNALVVLRHTAGQTWHPRLAAPDSRRRTSRRPSARLCARSAQSSAASGADRPAPGARSPSPRRCRETPGDGRAYRPHSRCRHIRRWSSRRAAPFAGAVEQVAQRKRDVIALANRIQRTVDRLRHRCLREDLVLLDGHRQPLAVVPRLDASTAKHFGVEAIRAPHRVHSRLRHCVLAPETAPHPALRWSSRSPAWAASRSLIC